MSAPDGPGDDVVLYDVTDGVATVTLNRPAARNALDRAVVARLPELVAQADADPDVAAVILTGADPAFCAGLDLKEVGRDGGPLRPLPVTGDDRLRSEDPLPEEVAPDLAGSPARLGRVRGFMLPVSTKPLIGAVNGVAVTGGLELALQCDFLVASERARFADTHARIGVQPLWGLTVLLPQAVGIRRAREMSATGNFVDARTALAWGLVNHVVAHDELLAFSRRLAGDIATNDRRALATLLDTYARGSLLDGGEAAALEREVGLEWQRSMFDPAEVERRRREVTARGRAQP